MFSLVLSCDVTIDSKLLWMVALGLGVIYMYSVVAFAFYAGDFNNSDSDENEYCDSLLQCFVTLIHYILIDSVS